MTEAQLRGDEKGKPVYDLDELAEHRARPLAGADRLPQGRRTTALARTADAARS